MDERPDLVIDPSPARQALDEVFAEYEAAIAERDRTIADLRSRCGEDT